MKETLSSRITREYHFVMSKVEEAYKEDPIKVLATGVAGVAAVTKLIDSVGHYRSRTAYAKRIGRR